MSKGQDASTRFNQLCDRRGAGECWLWLGAKRSAGHGQFRLDKVTISAHAASLILSGVPKPSAGAHALHSCDNPSCVNPAHLFLGTPRDNMHDKINKGRANLPYYPDEIIEQVRTRVQSGNETGRAIAKEFSMSEMLVSLIKHGYRSQ